MNIYKHIITITTSIVIIASLLAYLVGSEVSFMPHTIFFTMQPLTAYPYVIGNCILLVGSLFLAYRLIAPRTKERLAQFITPSMSTTIAAFLFMSGMSNLITVLNLWLGWYSLESFWTLGTGFLSILTVLLLYGKWDTLLQNKTPEELEEAYRVGLAQNEVFLDGFIVHNGKEILYANDSFCSMFGWEKSDIMGYFYPDINLFPAGEKERIKKKVEVKEWGAYPTVALHKTGRELHVIINAKGMQWEGQDARAITFRDITEEVHIRQKLDDQLERSTNLSTVRSIKNEILSSLNNGDSTSD